MADPDLFDEEDGMVRMTFGEHLEDLRRRLLLALIGFVPGIVIGLFLGGSILKIMKDPAVQALRDFYAEQDKRKADELAKIRLVGGRVPTKPLVLELSGEELRRAIDETHPELKSGEADPNPNPTSNPGPPLPNLTLSVRVSS